MRRQTSERRQIQPNDGFTKIFINIYWYNQHRSNSEDNNNYSKIPQLIGTAGK